MAKALLFSILIITALGDLAMPKLKQKVFMFANDIAKDYSVTAEITQADIKKQVPVYKPALPKQPQARNVPPPEHRPGGESQRHDPPQIREQPRSEQLQIQTPLAQTEKNNKDSQQKAQFQQFKNIEFKAARTYKVNNINGNSVLDAEGRIVPTSLLVTPSNIKYTQIVPKKPQEKPVLPRPQFPSQPQIPPQKNFNNPQNLRQNIQQPQTTDPTSKQKITKPPREQVGKQKNILKIIFTIMLGVSALIIIFGYKPEQRQKPPYIPSGDDEESVLRRW